MKKNKIIFTILVSLSLILTGCGKNNNNRCSSAHIHRWGEPSYVWSDDYLSCTAKRVCLDDATHVESATVISVYSLITSPGCETYGLGRYDAVFDHEAFLPQHHDVTLDALGHDWGAVTYTWADDNSTCSAKRACTKDETHIEEETATSIYQIVTPETITTDGEGKYVAEFTNPAFGTQACTVIIPKDKYAVMPHLSDDGKTVRYGLYPQTAINDSALITALDSLETPESNGWYLYNNVYYAKKEATPFHTDYVFDNGDTIVSHNNYWFECKPITWNVLSSSDNKYYLLSELLLDSRAYYASLNERTIDDQTIYPNNYKHSELRAWLNDEFYNSAFALGNANIQLTTIDNSASTTSISTNGYACENTEDKVFLLSYQDYSNANYGFSTSEPSLRRCVATDYARASKVTLNSQTGTYANFGFYWTRSPHAEYANNVRNISYDGSFSNLSNRVDYSSNGIRPAIVVSIA